MAVCIMPLPSRMTSTRQRLITYARARGVEITFEEDRQGGVLNGPRAYFHDPDGTVLEFIDLTSYAGSPS
jgi:catechol 2,3-dioxygenase-like lactoylglutathione lyase family enzyme